jgi:FxsC-like protein
MECWFFTSYARADRDRYLEQFVSDLREEVRRKHPQSMTAESIAFLDTSSIEAGEVWQQELSNALRTSQVCVALCSPRYFDSEYCGKEFHIFCERRTAYLRSHGTHSARVIFPVVWETVRGRIPEAVAQFQYTDDDFPRIYADEGLRYLMKLRNRYRTEYAHFVDRLASKMVAAGLAAPLTTLSQLPPLSSVPSAFRSRSRGAGTVKLEPRGPNNATFLFVVGSREQLASYRTTLHAYSDSGGWYWRPFYPESAESAGRLAQAAATSLDLRFCEIELTHNLIDQLEQARANNEPVVLVADPWSVSIEYVAGLMQQYDRSTLMNCGVLVAWNDTDLETRANENTLRGSVRCCFPQKTVLQRQAHQWDGIRSAAALKQKMEETLTILRLLLIEMREPERKVESAELLAHAREHGVLPTTAPIIQGTIG